MWLGDVNLVGLSLVCALTIMSAQHCKPMPAKDTAVAAGVAAYAAELAVCRAEGKKAHSYDVYEACALTIDAKYGRKP
jgi:hypothetical protein